MLAARALFDLQINNMTVEIETAKGTIYLDGSNRLTIDVTDSDLNIPLSWDVPEFLARPRVSRRPRALY